jgi:hypothetical protein
LLISLKPSKPFLTTTKAIAHSTCLKPVSMLSSIAMQLSGPNIYLWFDEIILSPTSILLTTMTAHNNNNKTSQNLPLTAFAINWRNTACFG